jgi:hypothetical protein
MAAVLEEGAAAGVPGRWHRWTAIALVVVGALRIAGTYPELSETVDEVAHVGAGMEWLARGQYTFELQHPPLARIAAAAGPYLIGIRSQGQSSMWSEGRHVLYADNAYVRNLTAARLGILPFFFIASFFVWRFGRVAFGPSEALGAVACFTMLPPILAHFGLATTDGPMLAMFAATVYAGVRWLVVPNVQHGAALGAAAALAVVSKFSALPYLGVTALLVCGAWLWATKGHSLGAPVDSAGGPRTLDASAGWPWKRALLSLVVAAIAAFLVTWAVYRFSIGTVRGIPMPLSELPKGMRDVAVHNRLGHPAYLLGVTRVHGVWYFFPVVLALKTPIAALMLGLFGFAVLVRRGLRNRDWVTLVPVLVAVAVTAVALPSSINIGVRHVLPFYVALSLAVGVAWVWLWGRFSSGRARVALGVGTAVLSLGTATVHPDYLAYFNLFAGRDPSRLLADSDLDWGQDLFRLRREAQARGIDTLTFAYIGTADLSPIIGVPVKYWDGTARPNGWVAIAETWYRRGQVSERRGRHVVDQKAMWWLDSAATFTRVGKGVRLYRIPPPAGDRR